MTDNEIERYNKLCANIMCWKLIQIPKNLPEFFALYPTPIWVEKEFPEIYPTDGSIPYNDNDFWTHFNPQYDEHSLNFHTNWNKIFILLETIKDSHTDGSRPYKHGKLDLFEYEITDKKVSIRSSIWTDGTTNEGNKWEHFNKQTKTKTNNSKRSDMVKILYEFLLWYEQIKTNPMFIL